MKALQFKLKIDHSDGGYSNQRQHRVECNGEIVGNLYDNRECDMERANFVFFPYPSRITGEFLADIKAEDREYLHRAKGVFGDDLAEVLDMVRDWGETVERRVNGMREEFRKVLDAIPDRPFTMRKEAQHYSGVTAKVLKGGSDSFQIELTWAELAKMYGSSYSECSEYQVCDCGVNDQAYGIKWQHMRNSPTIHAMSYSGFSFISIERSDAHRGE